MLMGLVAWRWCRNYISRLLGAKDYSKSKFVSSFSIYGGIALGLIVILVTYHSVIKSQQFRGGVKR